MKEVLGHTIDTERIMAYRRNGPFTHGRLSDLVEEFMHVRRTTVALFRNLDESQLSCELTELRGPI